MLHSWVVEGESRRGGSGRMELFDESLKENTADGNATTGQNAPRWTEVRASTSPRSL